MHNITKIIDAHFHIWDNTQLELPGLEAFTDVLKPKYTLDDYLQAINGLNIVKSCYTEVDTLKSLQRKEADMVVKLCEDESNQVVAATIGADLISNQFADYIKTYAKHPFIKSVRDNFFVSDPIKTTEKQFIQNGHLLGQLNIMCDLIMAPEKMLYGIDLVKACPETIFVIDHCGACPITADQKTFSMWQSYISQYAAQTNTICKISESGFMSVDYQWKIEDVTKIIRHCVDAFGEDRIVYASNWPVCEMTGTIERWIEAIHVSLNGYPQSVFDKLFYDNACRYYIKIQ